MKHHPIPFWLRVYLATLALFLLCLGGGVLGVFTVSRNASFEAVCGEQLARQHELVQRMAEDIAALTVRRPSALPELYEYHAGRCLREGIRLEVRQDGEVQFSNLSAAPELPQTLPGQRVWQVQQQNGQHLFCAVTVLSGELEGLSIGCVTDMEPFFLQWKQLERLFGGLFLGVSAVFAVGLYWVLRRLNRPIQSLTDTAASLAAGELSARAAVTGRDELGNLAQTMNRMAEQVETQLQQLAAEAQAKQTLVDNLSHEMRTPLTAIGGYAEYIQRAELSPQELLEATETIRFESKRLLNLSNQLVRLSVLNHEAPDFAPVDPDELLRRAELAVQPKAEARGVVLRVRCSETLPAISGNRDLLESLLVNLADNGIKACETGGTVTLCAEADPDGGCRFTVRDTGRGMDAETLANLGRPFYRADKARSRAEGGAGLGAALCKAIAEAHGTKLHYVSVPGQGTAVDFTVSQ